MIHWVPGTGLLSFGNKTLIFEFKLPYTSQDKKMLLVWRGSEISHHLSEELQKFCATFHGFLQWCQSALQYFQ